MRHRINSELVTAATLTNAAMMGANSEDGFKAFQSILDALREE